tara:strand:+ start:81 stop:461 length:381 start_codon:yes stop_codon:yes gene_type:complete
MASDLSSILFQYIAMGHVHPLEDAIISIAKASTFDSGKSQTREEEEASSKNRFALTEVETGSQCTVYENNGSFVLDGCVKVDENDNQVFCECEHYSNFGVLFGNSSNDVRSFLDFIFFKRTSVNPE